MHSSISNREKPSKKSRSQAVNMTLSDGLQMVRELDKCVKNLQKLARRKRLRECLTRYNRRSSPLKPNGSVLDKLRKRNMVAQQQQSSPSNHNQAIQKVHSDVESDFFDDYGSDIFQAAEECALDLPFSMGELSEVVELFDEGEIELLEAGELFKEGGMLLDSNDFIENRKSNQGEDYADTENKTTNVEMQSDLDGDSRECDVASTTDDSEGDTESPIQPHGAIQRDKLSIASKKKDRRRRLYVIDYASNHLDILRSEVESVPGPSGKLYTPCDILDASLGLLNKLAQERPELLWSEKARAQIPIIPKRPKYINEILESCFPLASLLLNAMCSDDFHGVFNQTSFNSLQLSDPSDIAEKGIYCIGAFDSDGELLFLYIGRSRNIGHRLFTHRSIITNPPGTSRKHQSFLYRVANWAEYNGLRIFYQPIMTATNSITNDILEPLFTAVFATYQKDKYWLCKRQALSLPSVSYIGLNRTACLEISSEAIHREYNPLWQPYKLTSSFAYRSTTTRRHEGGVRQADRRGSRRFIKQATRRRLRGVSQMVRKGDVLVDNRSINLTSGTDEEKEETQEQQQQREEEQYSDSPGAASSSSTELEIICVKIRLDENSAKYQKACSRILKQKSDGDRASYPVFPELRLMALDLRLGGTRLWDKLTGGQAGSRKRAFRMDERSHKSVKILQTIAEKKRVDSSTKLILASESVEYLHLMERDLVKMGVSTGIYHGGLGLQARRDLVERFNMPLKDDQINNISEMERNLIKIINKKIRAPLPSRNRTLIPGGGPIQVLLFSTTCQVEEGLDFRAASELIVADPSWNPETQSKLIGHVQCRGRINKLTVKRMLSENTIDELVDAYAQDKRWKSGQSLSQEELHEMETTLVRRLCDMNGATR